MSRVPATVSDAHAALASVDPPAMGTLNEGDRAHALTSMYGGVAQGGGLISSKARPAQAQRTIDQQWRQPRDQARKALKTLCGVTCAGEDDACQALATVAQNLQATCLGASTVRATPRSGKRRRLGQGAQPDQLVDQSEGALASSRAARQALIDQHRCFILVTNELDATPRPPHTRLEGDNGQTHVKRGVRFLKDSEFLASSLDRKKPERIMALVRVMTVCLLVYAALESRIRQALQGHDATFPHQQGTRGQKPTARWVLHAFVGIPLLIAPGQWPMVLNLTDEHSHRLRRLGKPYLAWYGVHYSCKSARACGKSGVIIRLDECGETPESQTSSHIPVDAATEGG